MRKRDWVVPAVGFLYWGSAVVASVHAADVAPLARETSMWLQRASVFDGTEHWIVGRTDTEFVRVDAANGAPLSCALTIRARAFATDPAIESVQVGIRRSQAAPRPGAIDGTVFVRARFADTATWRAVPVDGLTVALDRGMTTEGWRVDPPDAEGYMSVSKPTARSDDREKEAFGWMAAIAIYRVRIALAAGAPLREYQISTNRAGFMEAAYFDMLNCLMAMGDDKLTFGASMMDMHHGINPVMVPPERQRR